MSSGWRNKRIWDLFIYRYTHWVNTIIWLSLNSKVSSSRVVGCMDNKTPFRFEENAVISGNAHGSSCDLAIHRAHRHRYRLLLEHRRRQKPGSQKPRKNRSFFLLLYSKSVAWCCSSFSSFFFFFWFHLNQEPSLYSKCSTSPVSGKTYQCVNTGVSLQGLFYSPFSGNCRMISLSIKLQK